MKRGSDWPTRKTPGACGRAAVGVVFLLLVVVLSGCAAAGSGTPVTTQVDKAGFTKVRAADSWDVTLVRGDRYSVKVTTDSNFVDRLDVIVDGDTLVLRLKPGTWGTWTNNVTLKATVVMPRLDGLDLADASDASATGFSTSGPLTVSLHDSSSAVLNALGAGTLDARAADASSISGSIRVDEGRLRLSDSSDAKLSGSARVLNLQASDGSSADLRGLRAGNATAALTDGSDATVAVDGTLDAHLSDGSDLKYVGSPRLGSSISISDDSSLARAGGQAQ
jgi:hypothetical protein